MNECPQCGRKAAVRTKVCIYCGYGISESHPDPLTAFVVGSDKNRHKKHFYQEKTTPGKAAITAIYGIGAVVVILIIYLIISLNGGFSAIFGEGDLGEEDQMYYELSQIQAAMKQARFDLTSYPDFETIVTSKYLKGVTILSYSSRNISTQAARYQLLGGASSEMFTIYAETQSGSVNITIDQTSPDAKNKMSKKSR